MTWRLCDLHNHTPPNERSNLVPTLREQRADRQFIVISHDANIVVASDMEQITVLDATPDGSPYTGGLFDEVVRDAALEHLEGGREAFALRASLYDRLGLTLTSEPRVVHNDDNADYAR